MIITVIIAISNIGTMPELSENFKEVSMWQHNLLETATKYLKITTHYKILLDKSLTLVKQQ